MWGFSVWAHNTYDEYRNRLAEEMWLDPNGREFQPGGVYHETYQNAQGRLLAGIDHEHAIRDDFMRSLPPDTSEEARVFLWREAQPNADQVRQAQVAAMFEDGHLSPEAIREAMNDPAAFAKLGLTEPPDGWSYDGRVVVKAKNPGELPGDTVKYMERWLDGAGEAASVHYHQTPARSPWFGEPFYIKVRSGWTTEK